MRGIILKKFKIFVRGYSRVVNQEEITMELNFHNSKFEKEVRDRLGIYNRAITVEDARKVQELDFIRFIFKLIIFNNIPTTHLTSILKAFKSVI